MAQFSWLTFATAKAQLAQRLADPSNIFWTDYECGVYLTEALRVWNAMTEMFNADFAFTADASSKWYDLSTLAGSPRLRSVTDAQVYTEMEYMLLEPPTGAGSWTGTSQFTLADLQNALQRRRDELIQVAGCNMAVLNQVVGAGAFRLNLPDNVLEPRRARYTPATGTAVTLNLEDTLAMYYFEEDRLAQPPTNAPELWSVVTGPPLAVDFDARLLPGSVEFLILKSGLQFAPPAATLLGLPDDWAWVAMYGALGDLLGRESEATDRVRAQYCMQRYQDGMKMMAAANWLVAAEINAATVDTPSISEIDCYDPDWEASTTVWPQVVSGGTDFLAAVPVLTGSDVAGVEVTVVGNAPVPASDGSFRAGESRRV
jgi:hypothetical protein